MNRPKPNTRRETALPAMPAGGLTLKQLEHFVSEATRAHWTAYTENGGGPIFDHHLAQMAMKGFRKLWDEYNTEERKPEPQDGRLFGGFTEPLAWLDFDRFAPVVHFYPDEPIEKLAVRIANYTNAISAAQFLWSVTRGVAAYMEGEDQAIRYGLYNSDFTAPDEEFRAMRGMTPEALAEYYETTARRKFRIPLPFTLKDRAGKTIKGSADLFVELELSKVLARRELHLVGSVDIQFSGGITPWDIDPLGFWNQAEAAIQARDPELVYPDLDWSLYLESALLAFPEEEGGAVQEEIPLAIRGKASLAHFIDLTTFAFPSSTKSRLVTEAFGVQPSKEIKELSRILEKPEADRTEQEIRRAEEIKGGIILKTTHEYGDDFSPVGVTLETKVRDNNSISAKAIVTLRAESPEDGSAITQAEIDGAINTFLIHFGPTFHGQGLRHWALILKELIQNGWAYEFEATEHIAKMRTLKPGESPSRAEKEQARRIVTYLCDTFLDVQSKRGAQHATDAQRFFFIDRVQGAKSRKKGEVLTIRATPELQALFQSGGTALQYVPMLESVIREDHQSHGIALKLYTHFSPLWRMDPIRRMKVRDLFDLIGKDPGPENEHRMRDLKKLERELDYMVAQAPPYLGSWQTSEGDADRPSKCRKADPFECSITLIAPDWKRQGIEKIAARRAALLPKPATSKALTRETLEAAIKASGLSANKFAEAIGFSRGILSETRSGKRQVTPALEAKIRGRFPDLLPA